MSRFTSRDLMVSVLDGSAPDEDWADKTTKCTTCTSCTNVTNQSTRKPSKGLALSALRAQLAAARR
jgi:hypothetical protein